MDKAENTISYYDNNATIFAGSTLDVAFADMQNKYLSLLPVGSLILDFGCGSGRDTKYFLNQGFRVDATDGSAKICEIASQNAGIEVRQMLFSELDAVNRYDGIWACASILHLPKEELKSVFDKMIRALKREGYIYTSFKYGEFEGYRNDRYFTDFTEQSFQEFIKRYPEISIAEEWVSADVRPGRGEEKWLNVILHKSDII